MYQDEVVVGFVHPGTVRTAFMTSMLAMTRHPGDSEHAGRTVAARVAAVIEKQSGPNIAGPRNELAEHFLREKRAPWLLMLDTDMVFAPDLHARLLAAADAERRPVMGALCFYEDVNGRQLPTLYELVQDDGAGQPAFANYVAWPENEVMRVTGTGAACLLVHREALLAVKRGPKADPVWPWFKEVTLGTRRMGEDLTFMLRLGRCNIPVHVHTGVQCGHIKSRMIGEVR